MGGAAVDWEGKEGFEAKAVLKAIERIIMIEKAAIALLFIFGPAVRCLRFLISTPAHTNMKVS